MSDSACSNGLLGLSGKNMKPPPSGDVSVLPILPPSEMISKSCRSRARQQGCHSINLWPSLADKASGAFLAIDHDEGGCIVDFAYVHIIHWS